MKTITVAVHELTTRKAGKGKDAAGERERIAPGTHIDAKVRDKLGLTEEDLERLKLTGAVQDVPVDVNLGGADDPEVAKLREQLAEMHSRASQEVRGLRQQYENVVRDSGEMADQLREQLADANQRATDAEARLEEVEAKLKQGGGAQ